MAMVHRKVCKAEIWWKVTNRRPSLGSREEAACHWDAAGRCRMDRWEDGAKRQISGENPSLTTSKVRSTSCP